MRKKLMLLTALVLASVTLVSAEPRALAAVTIPFTFTVGETVLPAGEYIVSGDNSILYLRAKSGGAGSMMLIVARRAQFGKDAQSASLVFDKVGDRRYFSEFWLPGQDGFLVGRKSDKHTHDVLQAAE